MSVTVVVQARMGSSRLPGKVLRPLAGRPMLQLQLERLARLDIGPIVVATSTRELDDPIADLVRCLGVNVIRGSESDVLARFAAAVAAYPAEHVVRLTADCPLIDPTIISDVVSYHLTHRFDYTSTTLLRTYPDGLDVEVMRADALAEAAVQAARQDEREHVTPYLQRNPQDFHLGAVVGDHDLEDERWTIDTAEDFAWITSAFETIADPAGTSWLGVLDNVGVRFEQPCRVPRLHVYRGDDSANSPAGDPARRTWAVDVDGHNAGTIGIDMTGGGLGAIRVSACITLDKVLLLDALEQRLRADLQVIELVGPGEGWTAALEQAGFCLHRDGSHRRLRLPG